jgi:hypothetical protein
LLQGGAEVLEVELVGRQGGGIGLDAHRRSLAAHDADETDAGKLGDFLGQPCVGQVFHLV